MLLHWQFWCYLLTVCSLSTTQSPTVYTEEDGDYQVTTTVTSLTRSEKPFTYIDLTCGGNETSQCREFRCSAFSASNDTSIYWAFKKCTDEKCQFEPVPEKSGLLIEDSLQISSDISLEILDSGILRCVANNSFGATEETQEVVPVNNTGQRFLKLIAENLESYEIDPVSKKVEVRWNINVDGNPMPKLHLQPNNQTNSSVEKYDYRIDVNQKKIFLTIKNITTEDLGSNYSLRAENKFETKIFNLTFNISEIKTDGIMVYELNETYSTLKCSAQSILPCNISWSLKNDSCSDCGYTPMENFNSTSTDLQCVSFLRIESFTTGHLRCVVNNFIDTKSSYQQIDSIKESVEILSNDTITHVDESTYEVEGEISKPLVLTCKASAFNHTDEIEWAEMELEKNINDFRVKSIQNRLFSYQKILEIPALGSETIGKYFCKTILRNGSPDNRTINVKLAGTSKWPYYAIVLLLLTVVAISIFIGIKMRTYQKLQKHMEELDLIGLANFENGALEHLNPNLTIDDQADLLPYDKRYEFPIERLKLGEQIGSGAFGVVVKGEAVGVFENEPSTPVAVKMVNRNIGDMYIKALASELKIMIHLGKHLNIVNLLGACTKNITKRELLVIAEYCRFGNLKDYLLNHRNTFVDQIHPETGHIDFTIGGNALGVDKPELAYITPCFSNRFYEATTTSSNLKEIDKRNICPDTPDAEENLRYQGDYFNINKPVCTRDLLLWSFQVARGMEYLSSRRVLHGDLAARNVLLTDGNVVKICDFGLSKSMYQKDVYRKTGDEMLPVKWMAIEAITDKIFSVQSDVWSFGIVLWEIFSLARTPYPGMEYNETFCEKLLDGYRMKLPQYATKEIYEIMLHCWNADPSQRPSFTHLVRGIGNILDDKMTEHYIDMNTGYIKMNEKRFAEENSDYLSMIGAPDFKKFSSAYANVVKPGDEVNSYI